MSYTTIYQCNFCNDHESVDQGQADLHDARCRWNPKNRSCVTCADYRCPHHEIGVKPQRDCTDWRKA